jgi:hypothetical protein
MLQLKQIYLFVLLLLGAFLVIYAFRPSILEGVKNKNKKPKPKKPKPIKIKAPKIKKPKKTNKKKKTKASGGATTVGVAATATAVEEEQNYEGLDTYPYYKYIKTPKEMGMSSKGDTKTLSKDVNGLIDYMNVLVSGKSKASMTGQPLGNKYFIDTKATCIDPNGQEQQRFIYINNVPQGNLPFLTGVTGVNFSGTRGLIPGAISNLNVLNPEGIMNAFTQDATPQCQSITMQTIDNKNKKTSESHFVALADIKLMDPCSFPKGINPVTKDKCRQGFVPNMKSSDAKEWKIPKDPFIQFYYGSLGIFGIYIFYKLMKKS